MGMLTHADFLSLKQHPHVQGLSLCVARVINLSDSSTMKQRVFQTDDVAVDWQARSRSSCRMQRETQGKQHTFLQVKSLLVAHTF